MRVQRIVDDETMKAMPQQRGRHYTSNAQNNERLPRRETSCNTIEQAKPKDEACIEVQKPQEANRKFHCTIGYLTDQQKQSS